MSWLRGNPLALTLLFFATAVVLLGGIFTAWGRMNELGMPVAVAAMASMAFALAFTLLIIGRIFRAVSRARAK